MNGVAEALLGMIRIKEWRISFLVRS